MTKSSAIYSLLQIVFHKIIKTFFVILFALTIIAWTVRAVSFLDLIVENGYSVSIYFQYSLLNLFCEKNDLKEFYSVHHKALF